MEVRYSSDCSFTTWQKAVFCCTRCSRAGEEVVLDVCSILWPEWFLNTFTPFLLLLQLMRMFMKRRPKVVVILPWWYRTICHWFLGLVWYEKLFKSWPRMSLLVESKFSVLWAWLLMWNPWSPKVSHLGSHRLLRLQGNLPLSRPMPTGENCFQFFENCIPYYFGWLASEWFWHICDSSDLGLNFSMIMVHLTSISAHHNIVEGKNVDVQWLVK